MKIIVAKQTATETQLLKEIGVLRKKGKKQERILKVHFKILKSLVKINSELKYLHRVFGDLDILNNCSISYDDIPITKN